VPDAKAEGESFDKLIDAIREMALTIVSMTPQMPQEAGFAIKNIESKSFLVNYLSANTEMSGDEKQQLLELISVEERARVLRDLLSREIAALSVKRDIQDKAHKDIDKHGREYFLQQQMKAIQDELGGSPIEQEIREMRECAKTKKWNEEVALAFEKELVRLERMHPTSGEYPVQVNYLQTLLDLPWEEYTEDKLDLDEAKKVLDEDHYGLEEVKERILEQLAVVKLKGNFKSPIVCLYGPPGVGKTSLGKSVARVMGRKFGRISLGGLHDESEIRGHRKTYIGAMPGRIIQSIKRCGSSNPVIILDEVDKVGADFRGDPASALLEVLDPEQNFTFHDNFLEHDYDLSKVMFIATANNIGNIHPALRDRMEMINVSGYTLEEKVEIAKRYLVPKLIADHGLKDKQIQIPDDMLKIIIDEYTRESGVRGLEKQLAKVMRRTAMQVALKKKYPARLSLKALREELGTPKFTKEKALDNAFAGVVTGLAWTENGGEILFVEAGVSKGKGILSTTGNLGDVMKESAAIAFAYVKSQADFLKIAQKTLDGSNLYIHVPEGAIPKDGPSAGIAMVTAIASAYTQRKVRKGLDMTGEITLRGKVLPVGGIKEKILAAKRAGITDIILSEENKKNVEEIKKEYLSGLKFCYVSDIKEVLKRALE
jgi:ATP-dependent Lon protease